MKLSEELSKLDLQPKGCRIIVKEDESNVGGVIVIPKTAESVKSTEGTVLVIGKDVTEIEVGEKVFYGKYSGVQIKRGTNEFWLMNEEDVLCEVMLPKLKKLKKVVGGKHG